MALLSSILQSARKKEQGGFSALLSFLSQAKDTATKTIKPVSDFYEQTNDQRQQEVSQFIDRRIPEPPTYQKILNPLTMLTKPLAKFAGNMVLGQPNLVPSPNKPYKNWTAEEKKIQIDQSLSMAINVSGGMENKGLGKPFKPQITAPTQGPGQALSKAGVPEAQLAQNEAVRALRQSSPRGLLGESFAQTAFRREAKLAPGQVYDEAARFAKQREARVAKAASIFKFSHPFSPEQANVVSTWGRNVKEKANLLDYFRTPENVLTKVGLADESKSLRAGWEAYTKELPVEINRVSEWMKRVPSSDSSKRIFNYLDGKGVQLTPPEQEVAGQIKNYLKGWAVRLKLPEDKQVSQYITHIFEKDKVGVEFDPELAKLIDNKMPGSVYDPFLQKRQGMPNYVQDTWRALDAYVKRATRKVNMDEPLMQLSRKADNLDTETFKYVQRYASRINLRPTELDNLVDNLIKASPVGYRATVRPTAFLTGKFRQQVYRGALGLNIGSALRNLTQGINTYAQLGEKYTLAGYADLFKRMATGGLDELKQTGVLDDAILQDRTPSVYKGILKKADEGLFKLFDTAETINRGAAYFGAKKQAISKGMNESEAINFAKDMVRKTQFAFGAIDTPVALSSDIAKTLMQFKSFDIKQLEFIAGMAKNKQWGGLLRYIGASLVAAGTVGKLMGFDWRNFVPFSNARFDSPATQILGSAKDLLSLDADTRQQGKKDLVKSAALLIPGGVQIKKTIEGIQAYQEGASKTSTGRVRFQIPKTTGNLLQSAVFGQYSLPQAKEYFKNLEQGNSKSEVAYAQWKKLYAEDPKKAQEFGRTLPPGIISELGELLRDDEMGITEQEKKWKTYTVEKKADEIAKILKDYPKGTQERADKFNRWKQMGFISERVYEQLLILQENGKF